MNRIIRVKDLLFLSGIVFIMSIFSVSGGKNYVDRKIKTLEIEFVEKSMSSDSLLLKTLSKQDSTNCMLKKLLESKN